MYGLVNRILGIKRQERKSKREGQFVRSSCAKRGLFGCVVISNSLVVVGR